MTDEPLDRLTVLTMAAHTPNVALRALIPVWWAERTVCAACAEKLSPSYTYTLHAPLWWENCYSCGLGDFDGQTPFPHSRSSHAMVPYAGTGEVDGHRDG